MKTNRTKLFAIIFFAIPLLLLTIFKTTPVQVAASAAEDPAVTYKTKCAACHTPTAAKFYDAAKSDEHHVQAILKGQKADKPPFMPGYEAKGMTEEEAKALAAHMRSMKPAK